MSRKTNPSKGPFSPFSIGGRALVARTCVTCRRLADAASFPIITGTLRRRSCHDCVNAQKKRDREERGIGLPPPPRPPEPLQVNKRRQWTKAEDDFLREHVSDTGYEELAVKLGRSVRAVYIRRDRLGLPKVRKEHRVAEPWRIVQ